MKSFLSDIPSVLFLTGIGTDVGKSWATGWLAREMMQSGLSVITQKHIQTGNRGMSEDIELHRKTVLAGKNGGQPPADSGITEIVDNVTENIDGHAF